MMTKDEALNIAAQCRATASHSLACKITVDGGGGLLTELLLDAARVIEALAQPAQPAQEPVDNDFFKHIAKKNPSPDQRPWQGLTPEEIKHLYPYGRSVWGKETYEAIEKALKEKNT